MLGAGWWLLADGWWMLGGRWGWWMFGDRWWMVGGGYWVLGGGCWVLGGGCWVVAGTVLGVLYVAGVVLIGWPHVSPKGSWDGGAYAHQQKTLQTPGSATHAERPVLPSRPLSEAS